MYVCLNAIHQAAAPYNALVFYYRAWQYNNRGEDVAPVG